ncbi:MAG: helix-turn-helix transcriptional regulator [Clostridia bacterium]|nr:helix-turn-helix transcriptional regulator [Clostridia bacterium]
MSNFVQLHSQYRSNLTKNLAFPPHLHSHIEMVYVWEGSTTARVDGTEYTLSPGDMLIVFPNCVHSYSGCNEGKYFCAIFPCEAVPKFGSLFTTKRPQNPFVPARKMSREVKTMLGLLSRSGEKNIDLFSGVMTAVLAETLPHTEIADGTVGGTVKRILDYCLLNYREPLTLSILSKDLHISPSRLSHIFEEKVGLPFRYYINYLRVLEACRMLLSTDMGISDIAYACGFDSIRSFNRNFLYIIGTTPTEYKNGADFTASNIF